MTTLVAEGHRPLSRRMTAVDPSNSRARSRRAQSDYAVEVGRRIVQARKELGLTQEELAELAGVSQRSMQAYETGEVIPYRKMREIAGVVQRSTSWILHGEEGETPEDRIDALEEQIAGLTKAIRALTRKLQD